MKKILVTGAGGFVGHNLANYLVKNNYDVYGTYRRKLPKNIMYKAIPCDLSKDISIDEDFDVVFHLASQIEVTDNINVYIDNTINTTKNISNYCEKKSIKKIIYMSSIAVYGECNNIVDENSDRINQDNYALTKYISEKIIEASDIQSKIVIRLPRTLGKGVDYTHPWIPLLSFKLIKNEIINYYCPELLYNNLLYIDDLNEFCKLLIEKEIHGYECIGLGSKYRIPVIEIINTLKKYLNSQSELVEKNNIKPNTCFGIDISKAINMGFQPMDTHKLLFSFAEDTLNKFKTI